MQLFEQLKRVWVKGAWSSPRAVRPRRSLAAESHVIPAAERLESRTLLSAAPVSLTNVGSSTLGSSPNDVVPVGTTTYFVANDGIHGSELWKLSGTLGAPALVSDIVPGSQGSYPSNLTNLNGTLFFTANDGTNGVELWKSDGTVAGTVLVSDISPGSFQSNGVSSPLSSSPSQLTNVSGTLFFTATDNAHGTELWKSDGTVAGTQLVSDINPNNLVLHGVGFPYSSTPASLTNVSGTLFFTADDGTHGRELWKSNGTSAGTLLVNDIDPDVTVSPYGYSTPSSSNPDDLTNVNGTLFFAANDGINGTELWASDGTAAGTVLVSDINPGTGLDAYSVSFPLSSDPSQLTNVNGTLFFSAVNATTGTELWKSDGTAAGTVLVNDINPGVLVDYYGLSTPLSSDPLQLTNVNGTLYFAANDGTTGTELWMSDGTAAGTVLVDDINPGMGFDSNGVAIPLGSNLFGFTNVNGVLYFTANDGTHGQELWASHGSAAGTVLVKDINPYVYYGGASSYPASLTNVNGILFFSAFTRATGQELWKSDGSVAGTVLVKDINSVSGPSSSAPSEITEVNGISFFTLDDGTHGRELWKSDGTPAGTVLVSDINPGNAINSYGVTVPSSSDPNQLTNVNGTLFFSANDGTHGEELWKSDGTAAGTFIVSDINAGTVVDNGVTTPLSSNPAGLVNVNGILFLTADDGTKGRELWKSDGTVAGTTLVSDINPGSILTNGVSRPLSSYPSDLTNVNGTLFFAASTNSQGTELWKSDGTAAGTTLVSDIDPNSTLYGGGVPFPGSSFPANLTNVNGKLFFTANDGVHGNELWESNGTALGTTLVNDINSGSSYGGFFPLSSYPSNLTNVSGTLFFAANDGVHGTELWKSDGTPSGTVLVSDINFYSAYGSIPSSAPAELTNVNGTLFFTANDGFSGTELWESDGTTAGTLLVRDINPGFAYSYYGTLFPYSSYPAGLTNVNGILFFSASDGTTGRELWESNGTFAGTVLVSDLNAGSAYYNPGSYPSDLTNVNGTLFFAASATHGPQLWDLPVTNPNVTLSGTAGDDVIVFLAGDTTDTLTINGVASSFSTAGLSTITIDSGAGLDTIEILGTNTGIATTVTSAGTAMVKLGAAGSVQGLAGAVFVTNTSGVSTTLDVDDSADTTGRTVTFDSVGESGTIAGLASEVITYSYSGIQSANVRLGTGTNAEIFYAPLTGGTGLNVVGGGVNDVASLVAAGNDVFVGSANQGRLSNDSGYSAVITGVGTVAAYAAPGGTDQANFDLTGDPASLLVGAPGETYAQGPGFATWAFGFGPVYAYGKVSDVAKFSPGEGDTMIGTPEYGYITGPGNLVQAFGFGNIYGYGDFSNSAHFFPGTGDGLIGTSVMGYISGAGYVDAAVGFGNVSGHGDSSNFAQLYPATDDALVGTPKLGYIFGADYQVTAEGFGNVYAYGDSSNVADLYPAEHEEFFGSPAMGYIAGAAYVDAAVGFGRVSAYGNATNVAILKLAPQDIYVAYSSYGYTQGHGYLNLVDGFGNVQAFGDASNTAYLYLDSFFQFASLGGQIASMHDAAGEVSDFAYGFGSVIATAVDATDRAYFYDSPGNDTFYGRSNYAGLIGTNFIVAGVNFGIVNAYSVNGGLDHLDIAGLDYIFTEVGFILAPPGNPI